MEWQTLPAIAAVVVGVLVILWAGPAQPPAVAERQEC
jgi:hypothetical protein